MPSPTSATSRLSFDTTAPAPRRALKVLPLNNSQTIAAPNNAPSSASATASTTIDIITAVGLNPIARSVANSVLLALTAEYMVFAAPNIAPSAMMLLATYATKDHELRNGSDCIL